MENLKTEYKKSLLDASGAYFIEKYLLPLFGLFRNCPKMERLTAYQKNLLEGISEGKDVYVVKGRQGGYSSLIAMRMLYDIVMSDGNEDFMIFGGSFRCSLNVLNMISGLAGQVPAQLWTVEPSGKRTVRDGVNPMTFSNGCRIFLAEYPSDLKDRLPRLKKIYLDEWLFADNAKTMYELLKTDYGGKAQFIMGSSPNNDDSLGYNSASEFYYLKEKDPEKYGLVCMPPIRKKSRSELMALDTDMLDEYWGVIKKTVVFDKIRYSPEGPGAGGVWSGGGHTAEEDGYGKEGGERLKI